MTYGFWMMGAAMGSEPPTKIYLDDLATQPLYVCSLKRLISTATLAVRVRRSSDNAEQDIGFSGDSLDTGALASFVGSDSAYVVTSYDQTGNGYDWTQTTASKQPRIVNAGSYEGIVTFDGTDDAMSTDSVALNQAQMALFLDGTLPSYPGTCIYLEASDNWNSNAHAWVIAYTSSTWQCGMNSVTPATNQKVVNFSTLNMGARKILSALFDRTLTGTNQIRAWTDGGAISGSSPVGYTTNQSGTFATHDHYLGGRGGTSLYAAPTVFSLVCYNGDVASIRTNIEAILAA